MSTTEIFCLGSGKGIECIAPPCIISDDDMEADDARILAEVASAFVRDGVDGPSASITIEKGSTVVDNCSSVAITVQHTHKAKKVAVIATTGCFRRIHRCLVM